MNSAPYATKMLYMLIEMVLVNIGNDFSFKTYLLQYEKINSLGKGGFGSVFKAKNIITGDMVAIKYIDITYCCNSHNQ